MSTKRTSRNTLLEEEIREVTDPRDFLRTSLPQLTDIDTLLRCHICKDFIKIPVLAPCGHTFCSLCIREYLNRELKCPLCLAELRESMLRSDFLVNEIIGSYKQIRARLLEILDASQKSLASASENSLIEIVSGENEGDPSDDDLKIIATRENRPAKRGSEGISISNKKARREHGNSGITSMFGKPREKVEEEIAVCPICEKLFALDFLQRTHLDCCLKNMNPTVTSSKSSSPVISSPSLLSKSPALHIGEHTSRYLESGQKKNQSRLPKLNFSSLSQAQLKQKLASLSLPISGSRQQMINRYNHFEMIWNSNFLDSMESVSERDLRRMLASWESNHNNADPSQGKNSISTMLSGISTLSRLKDFKNDRFDRKGWMIAHRNEFRELLAEAKEGLKETKNSGMPVSEHSNDKEPIDLVAKGVNQTSSHLP